MAVITSRAELPAIKTGDVIDYRRWRKGSRGHRGGRNLVAVCECGERGLETRLGFDHVVRFIGWGWQIEESCVPRGFVAGVQQLLFKRGKA